MRWQMQSNFTNTTPHLFCVLFKLLLSLAAMVIDFLRWFVCIFSARHGELSLYPTRLTIAPVSQLVRSGVWLFPAQRTMEGVLLFCRLWLRRELQLNKFAALNLSPQELDENMSRDEDLCLDLCCRLAFGMFKRGGTSWTKPRLAAELIQTRAPGVVQATAAVCVVRQQSSLSHPSCLCRI